MTIDSELGPTLRAAIAVLELATAILPRVQDEADRDALAAKCDELIAKAKATIAARTEG